MKQPDHRPASPNKWQQRLQRLRGNKFFEWITVTVIVLSSMIIGAKTYSLPPLALLVLKTLDIVVIVYFVIEIVVRISAEERMRDFFKSGWNIFDALIVATSLIPLGHTEYVLLGRLLRLFRVMRLIVFLPQLRELVSSLLLAIPKVGYVLLMMFIVFYIYGAFGSLMFDQINPALWGDIGTALRTLFQIATFDDWAVIMDETMAVYPLSWVFYVSFIFLAAFVFLNMIIGVIIEVMQEKSGHKLDCEVKESRRRMERVEGELGEIRASLGRLEGKGGD